MRAMQAAERRQQREAIKRQRELDRHVKEMAKITALEQARVEVETYENALDVLLSVHKEQVDPMDWLSIATALPPVPPSHQAHNELKARQRLAITAVRKDETEDAIDQAKKQDEHEYQQALEAYTADYAEWAKMSHLARRILAADSDAYIPAIDELNPFSELAIIGSSLHYTVQNPRLVEVVVSTNGRQAIPTELKTLTASGKVSVKAMPKSRFVEIYQDYVCSCVLRVARELFALLPIESLLISATVEALDKSTGQPVERPFLSVVISRATLNTFNFDTLDPSDSVMGMTHRGDLKASRKTGDFEFITPLNVADLTQHDAPEKTDFNTVLVTARRLRADLATQCSALNAKPAENLETNGDT
jgi:hypothetical protein